MLNTRIILLLITTLTAASMSLTAHAGLIKITTSYTSDFFPATPLVVEIVMDESNFNPLLTFVDNSVAGDIVSFQASYINPIFGSTEVLTLSDYGSNWFTLIMDFAAPVIIGQSIAASNVVQFDVVMTELYSTTVTGPVLNPFPSMLCIGGPGCGPTGYSAVNPIFPDAGVLTSISIDRVGEVRDVPEPTTLAIFALGIIGLASRRFKKQS